MAFLVSCRWLRAVLPFVLSACALEAGQASDEQDLFGEGEVQAQASALGAASTLLTVDATRVLQLDSSLAVFARDRDSACATSTKLWRYTLSNGNTTTTTSCSDKFTTGGGDSTSFVFDTDNDDIFRWSPGLTKIADTVGNAVGPVVVDASNVYWADGGGVKKVARTGGAITTLVAGQFKMLGIDSVVLYYEKRISSSQYELWTVATAGGIPARLLVMYAPTGFNDFAFDPSYFIWVDNVSSVHGIRYLKKDLQSNGYIITSTTDTFHQPTLKPNGSGLYFAQKSLAGVGTVTIRKFYGGNFTDERVLLVDVLEMFANNTSLWWVEDWGANKKLLRATQ